jgi:predicted lipid-binding transport protein (Tim44 family)
LLDDVQMNKTYKSLVAARPSAASYSIALADLATMTTSTPGVSSSTAASTHSASATPSASSATPSPSPSSSGASGGGGGGGGGLSGGAIGGIVGGVVGGLALIGAVAFLLWRRKKYSTIAQADPTSPSNGQHPNVGYHQGTGYQPGAAEMHSTSSPPAAEKYANNGYTSEMPAYQQPAEMSAHRY